MTILADAIAALLNAGAGVVLHETEADGTEIADGWLIDSVQLVHSDATGDWINLVLLDERDHVRHIVDWHDDGEALTLLDDLGREIVLAALDPAQHPEHLVAAGRELAAAKAADPDEYRRQLEALRAVAAGTVRYDLPEG